MASAAELAILITGKNTASKAFNDASKSAGGFSKALKNVATIASGILVAKGIMQLPGLMSGMVDKASDLAESMGKVQVVFGKNSAAVQKWADSSAKAFGQSKQQALEAAGTYGNLFRAFGIGEEKTKDMSTSLVELAADLASFNNTSVDDAILALRSGLSGETEPLKRYGIAINDARLKTEALSMGLIKSTKEALTPGAKAQASYALIMKDSTLAQGDFTRTSEGLANKQRIVAAETANVSAQLGEKLMPVMLKFKELQLAVVQFMADRAVPAFAAIADVVQSLVAPALERLRLGFETVKAAVEPLVHLFQLGFNGGQIGGEFNTIHTAAFQVGNFFREVMVPAFHDAKNAVHLFLLAVQGGSAGGELTTLQQKALALGASVRKMWFEDIKPALIALADIVVTTVKAINDNWGTIGPILEAGVKVAVGAIEQLFRKIGVAVSVVSDVIQGIDDLIHGRWSEVWERMKEIGAKLVGEVVTTVVESFGGLPARMFRIGQDIIQGLWDGMKAKWESVKSWFSDAVKSIPDAVMKVLKLGSPSKVMHDLGVNTMQGYLNGLQSKAGEVAGFMEGMSGAVGSFVEGSGGLRGLQGPGEAPFVKGKLAAAAGYESDLSWLSVYNPTKHMELFNKQIREGTWSPLHGGPSFPRSQQQSFYGPGAQHQVGSNPSTIHVHVEINQNEIGRAIVNLAGSGGLRGVL